MYIGETAADGLLLVRLKRYVQSGGNALGGADAAVVTMRRPGEVRRRIFLLGIHCSVMSAQPELRPRVIVDQWVDPLIRADE